MQRILIIGSNGAGKTTFSYRLAQSLGLPLVHLDSIHWRGGWQRTPREEFEALVLAEARKERWIIEGNNIKSLHRRLPYADTVFWFELPPPVCVASALLRELRSLGRARPEMPPGCVGRIDLDLLRFLKYAWEFNRKNRGCISSLLARSPHVRVIRFTTRRQAEKYLRALPLTGPDGGRLRFSGRS